MTLASTATTAKVANVAKGVAPRSRNQANGTLITRFSAMIEARLLRPDIVASVAMNGGRPNRLIRKAWNRPIPRPSARVKASARRMMANDGSVPGATEPSHCVISLAQTTEDRATTAPTERSMPPEMITTEAPTARTP